MKQTKSDLLQGTLDLLILRTLAAGDMHGWGIAQRLQQISQDVLQVNQGSLYPALYRLEQQGWIEAAWGDTENNRRAKYYSLTKSGRKQLAEETASWERIADRGHARAAAGLEPTSCRSARGFAGFAVRSATTPSKNRWRRSCATTSSSRPRCWPHAA